MQQTFTAKLAQISMAIACASMLAACGGGGGDSDGDKKPGTEQPGGGNNNGGSNSGGNGSSGGNGGSNGGGSNTNGSGLHPAGDFKPTTVKPADRSATIDPSGSKLFADPRNFLYFKTNRATQFVEGWKYTEGSGSSFAYDLGQYVYVSDINKFEEPSSSKQLSAYSFLGDQLLMGCEAANWQSTFVVSLNAVEVTHLAELDGKSYKQYSCDPGEVKGYDPITITGGKFDGIPVTQLFSPSGFNDGNDTYYYKAYKIANKIFAVGHDKASAGVSLIIQD